MGDIIAIAAIVAIIGGALAYIIHAKKSGKKCICSKILRVEALPSDCPSFASVCTPETPLGACMVSSEGSCAAYYKYER